MWKEVTIVFLAPMARSGAGWLIKALADNKVTLFEWRELSSTLVRVGFISGVAYFGLDALGMDVGALATSCGAILFDMVIRAMKKKK